MTLLDLFHAATWISLVLLIAVTLGAVWAVAEWGMDRYIGRPLHETRSGER